MPPLATRTCTSPSSPSARDAAAARGLRTSLPVGYDHDGAVANEYAVVVCPTLTFVARGGRVEGSTVGALDDAALESWVKRIS